MYKNYEELDPDNQDRSSDYYLGVMDAARYFEDLMIDLKRSLSPSGEEIIEIEERLLDLHATCQDRRRQFFAAHMGASIRSLKKSLGVMGSSSPVNAEGGK